MSATRNWRIPAVLAVLVLLGSTSCSRVSLVGRYKPALSTLNEPTNSGFRITAGGGVVAAPGMTGYTAIGESMTPNIQTGTGIRVITNTAGAVPSY